MRVATSLLISWLVFAIHLHWLMTAAAHGRMCTDAQYSLIDPLEDSALQMAKWWGWGTVIFTFLFSTTSARIGSDGNGRVHGHRPKMNFLWSFPWVFR